MSMSFDSQPMLHDGPPTDPELLDQWTNNRDRLIVSLTQEFGPRDFQVKLDELPSRGLTAFLRTELSQRLHV